jgi:hypothetical protein
MGILHILKLYTSNIHILLRFDYRVENLILNMAKIYQVTVNSCFKPLGSLDFGNMVVFNSTQDGQARQRRKQQNKSESRCGQDSRQGEKH